jgi:hypothetical protein
MAQFVQRQPASQSGEKLLKQRLQHKLYDEQMSLTVQENRDHVDIPLSPCELSNIRGPGAVKDVSSTAAQPPKVAVAVEPTA